MKMKAIVVGGGAVTGECLRRWRQTPNDALNRPGRVRLAGSLRRVREPRAAGRRFCVRQRDDSRVGTPQGIRAARDDS